MQKNSLSIILASVVTLIIIGGVYFAFFRKDNNPITGLPAGWHHETTDHFALDLPDGWKLKKQQGIDSYVGEITHRETKLTYDFGMYSNSLERDGSTSMALNHNISYEMIHGKEARVVTPHQIGSGTTGVHFGNIDGKNTLTITGQDLSGDDQETALQIFRSITF